MLILKACGAWLIMLLVAFLNGALRELLLIPRLGDQSGHVISVLVLSSAIFAITYVFVRMLGPLPSGTLFGLGVFWLILSLLFEFGFFHYVMHEPWCNLLADYNIFQGRWLIVVWLTTLWAPLICGSIG
jgi:hypothetical protein